MLRENISMGAQHKLSKDLSPLARYRLAILSRTLLAVLGGYLATSLITASLALALPLPKPQAVLAATQLSFAFFCALVIWAFCASSPMRAWLVTVALCVPPALYLLAQGVWS